MYIHKYIYIYIYILFLFIYFLNFFVSILFLNRMRMESVTEVYKVSSLELVVI